MNLIGCMMDRKMLTEREKNRLVGVLVAYLADEGEDMYHIKIWVYTWPGAFIICPGSSIVAEVMCMCRRMYFMCVCAYHLKKKS